MYISQIIIEQLLILLSHQIIKTHCMYMLFMLYSSSFTTPMIKFYKKAGGCGHCPLDIVQCYKSTMLQNTNPQCYKMQNPQCYKIQNTQCYKKAGGRGHCPTPGVCSCREGWQGERCEECATKKGCRSAHALL